MIVLRLFQNQNIDQFLSKLKNLNISFFTFYNSKNENFHSSDSRFPYFVFVFSLITFFLVMTFQFWASSLNYSQNLSGKPNFYWIVAIPVSFEISLLVAATLLTLRLFHILKHNNSSIPKLILRKLQFFSNYLVLIFIDSNNLSVIKQYAEKCFDDLSKIEVLEIE
ncbi:MAG: quinol:electron acceptor oxidoreductase subunit ActD [Candidatus Kapaibacteriales bacterium]